jgi:serine/threonine-protein kinase
MSVNHSLSRERWQVLEPLLNAALDLEHDERAAYVNSIGARDTRLRADLAALLAACEESATLFAEPAVVQFEPLLTEEVALPSLVGDRYQLVRVIARGGMGTVYLADDPRHGRQVAIKVLHPRVARRIGRDRFRREIEIAARLSHPHILALHDSGEITTADDVRLLYYVSPFVTGESLRARLERVPALTLDETLRLGREVAQALDYAHRQGVVHLDVKPENILLQDGHAIVADFGIAHAMSDVGDLSSPDEMPVLGTPSYMSPEHARGARDVDGRSDIYALGCVLCEMILGRRPFAAASTAKAAERSRAVAASTCEELVERSSRATATAIVRAMAPERDDRFQTAEAFATALAVPTRPPTKRAWRRSALAAAALLVITSPAAVLWARNRSHLDDELIAVAPFNVAQPSLELWKEGMVDVLARNFDGAGSLRSVPATVAVKKWTGRVDAQSARELGVRTGARLVLFGGLIAAGDSVRASATVIDVHTGQTLAEVEQRDLETRMDRLSDSLTVAVLRELQRSRRLDMARATSAPTGSLPALKAYLKGEQFYRVARWDSAQLHFERALSLDSTFALAYHRLGGVRRWRDSNDVLDSRTFVLMQRASRFARGLAPRERLLTTIDSLYAEAFFAWQRGMRGGTNFVEEQTAVARLIATIGDGLVRYPNDPELSFLLGEARGQFDRDVELGERNDRELLALYDRTIALDSTFAPAYLAPVGLAAYLDGAASALRYTRAYLALTPTGPKSQLLRLDAELLDPSRASSLDVARLVDTLPPAGLCEAVNVLRHIPDETELIQRFAKALAEKATRGEQTSVPGCAAGGLVDGLLFRGHLREAALIAANQAHWLTPVVTLHQADYGIVATEVARADLHRLVTAARRGINVRFYPWWAADGDTAAIRAYITTSESSIKTRAHDPSAVELLRANIAAGNAYLALARRDTGAALSQLLSTRDTLHACWHMNRATTANLLVAIGWYREAAQRLERRWPGTSECSDGVDDVEWTLTRARVFDKLGRRDEARANYEFVARAWRTADPELQPRVREARAAIARLQK